MHDGFYEEGKKAFEDGKSLSDNPYTVNEEPESGYVRWVKGYLDAKAKYLKWKWLFDLLYKYSYA